MLVMSEPRHCSNRLWPAPLAQLFDLQPDVIVPGARIRGTITSTIAAKPSHKLTKLSCRVLPDRVTRAAGHLTRVNRTAAALVVALTNHLCSIISCFVIIHSNPTESPLWEETMFAPLRVCAHYLFCLLLGLKYLP
jgi:hypothetical protein